VEGVKSIDKDILPILEVKGTMTHGYDERTRQSLHVSDIHNEGGAEARILVYIAIIDDEVGAIKKNGQKANLQEGKLYPYLNPCLRFFGYTCRYNKEDVPIAKTINSA
jgi:hypothetical protein